MFNNPKITQYKKELEQQYIDEKDWFYAPEFMDGGFITRGQISDCLYEYTKEFSNDLFFVALDALSLYSLDRATYFLTTQNSKEKFFEHFSLYAYYSYLTIHETSKGCQCLQGIPYLEMQRSANFFASNIIARQWDKVELTGKDLINSLNAEGCIIKRGDAKALQAWFLLELYSQISGYEINKRRAFYPKEFYPYDEVLKKWDTTDLNEVDKYVYILCDAHLETTGRNSEERELYLEIPLLLLFPFEVLSWLRFRENQGLENPKEFSHPLMNEQTVKTLLENKTQITEPNKVPLLNAFLEPIYKHCPDMQKDSKFLIEQEEISKPLIELKTAKKLAPKTGQYQATLPENHPQAKALKADPQAYFTYNEGEHFRVAGLEAYDIEKIEWVFVE